MVKPQILLRDIKPNTTQASIIGKLIHVEEELHYNSVLKSYFKLLIFNDEQDEYRISVQLYQTVATQELFKNIHGMVGDLFLIDNVYAIIRDEHLEIRSEPFKVEKVKGNNIKQENDDLQQGREMKPLETPNPDMTPIRLNDKIVNLSSAHYQQVFLNQNPLFTV